MEPVQHHVVDFQLWIQPRPWLELYGGFFKHGLKSTVALAPIQRMLNDDIMRAIFHKLPPAACPSIWQAFCANAFSTVDQDTNMRLLKLNYGYSWKRMWVERPHLRFDGIYVSRNSYFRVGAAIFSVRNPVHLVVFYRFYRFFSDGTLLTRTSPMPVSKVWPSLSKMPHFLENGDSRLPGKWKLKVMHERHFFPNRLATHKRRLHSSEELLNYRGREGPKTIHKSDGANRVFAFAIGLNNRLDVEELFTYDHSGDLRINLDDPAAEDEDQEKTISNRGVNTLVFVHHSEVNSHIINLPKDKMDFWIPG